MAQRGSFGAVDIIADMKNFTGGRFKGIDLNALAERAKPKRSFHSKGIKFLNNEGVDQPANLLHRLFPLRGSGSIGMLASIGFMLFEVSTWSKNGSQNDAQAWKESSYYWHSFLYIATVQSMTTFPVVASLLTELKILNSELGRLALSSSMVSEAYGPPLGTALVSQFESLTMGLLLPLFLTVSGLRTDIPSLRKNVEEAYALPILVITCSAGKILATMIVCLYFRMPKREALALGVIMSAKGIVELSTYNVWRDSEVLNDSSFTLMILAVLVIASIVPCIVRYLYDPAKKYAGYDRRTILHSKAYSKFKVLPASVKT
ncbi:hypothetical protein IFM89_026980 [Coptis chinensis]|uniref:Cation/H+ exchanger transmembrane domain-containing protein n=1 Tax=Coptis chinensis TaxID=261450 RepID=A0A835H9G2_9MAGN|nr:hypothetical protein IFM89_026980 [Coptis chinensis]